MRGNFFNPRAVLNIPARIMKAKTEKVNGVSQITYEEGSEIFLGARNNSGTDTPSEGSTSDKKGNGVVSVNTTMKFTGYYTPELTSRDRIKILSDGSEWEIIGDVENINLRGLYMRFSAKNIHG